MKKRLPMRPFGKTGRELSVIGLGAYHLMYLDRNASGLLINRALDEGINFIETGSMYGDSEVKIGAALKGRKEECFVSTKVPISSRQEVARTIERSLNRLQTDRLDLVLLHQLMDFGSLRQMFEPEGAMAALIEAREQGKISLIGLTAHVPETQLKALDMFPFDAILTFVNYVDRFIFPIIHKRLIPTANERGVAVVGMKVFGKGRLKNSIPQALKYALSQPISTATVGMGSLSELEQNVKLAREFVPMDEAEMESWFDQAPELGIEICRLCNKCLPCPAEIDIPAALRAGHIDDQVWYGTQPLAQAYYQKLSVKAEACFNCGDCEPRCPHNIPIRWQLRNLWVKMTPPEGIPQVFRQIQISNELRQAKTESAAES
ncbi:MAG: aldo/keto reductase [Acidobacteria bacterium]|nr:aldo/keto reductase [Acidobacteriota bacterium]